MLPKLVAFLRLDDPLENVAQNVGRDEFEIERLKILDDRPPGFRGIGVPENVRPGPVLRLGVKKCFVIAGFVHGILEGFLEMPVKLARRL